MNIVKRLIVVGVICAGLPACSSTMTRFDYPVMGMNGEKSQELRSKGASDYSKSKYAQSKYTRQNGELPSLDSKKFDQAQYEQNSYQNSYDKNRYQAPARNSYGKDYAQTNRRSYEQNYQPKKLYKENYGNRDVYDTASTKDRFKRNDTYQNTQRYDYNNQGVKRDQLPDLYAKDRAKVDRYSQVPENTKIAAPKYTAASSAKKDAQGRHVVVDGDTMYNVSRRYSVTTDQIRSANDMQNNDIKLGQRLYIPGLSQGALPKRGKSTASLGGSKRHLVQQGDTIYNISRRYGVTGDQLAQANGLDDMTQVKLGQTLNIPKTGRSDKGASVKLASIDRKSGVKSFKRMQVPTRKKKTARKSHKIKSVDSGARAKLASNHSFVWPANGRILSSFGRQKSGTINDGVNLALPKGTKVKAAEGGVVAYAGKELKGYGNLILIRHSNNWVTAYAHNSRLLVKRGQKVRRGQAIAKSGKSGSVHQPQLHFELRKGSKPVNPMKYLAMR